MPVICLSICKRFTFLSYLEPQGQFPISNLTQNILGLRKFKFVQIKGHVLFKGEIITNKVPHPFQRRVNYKIAKIHQWNLKILFLRTTGPILTKLGTKHSWVKGIYGFFFNEAPHSIPREENYEIRTIH